MNRATGLLNKSGSPGSQGVGRATLLPSPCASGVLRLVRSVALPKPRCPSSFRCFDGLADAHREVCVIRCATAGDQRYHHCCREGGEAGGEEREAGMESSAFREAERALELGGEQAVFDVLAQTFMQAKDYAKLFQLRVLR